MNTLEESSARAFRALAASLFGVFILIVAASFLPEKRLWGINHLAFYGVPVRLIALALMALSFVPGIARALCAAFMGSVRLLLSGTARGWLLTGAVVVAGMAILFLFRIDAHVLSEGRFLSALLSPATESAGPVTVAASEMLQHERIAPGTMLLYLIASKASFSVSESGIAGGILVLNLFLFGVFAFFLIRLAPKSKTKRPVATLLIYLAVFSGALALFAGYLSKYTPFLVLATLYVLFAFRYLRKNEGLGASLVLLACACFAHIFGIMLVPSGIYLLIRRMKGGLLREHRYIVYALIAATVGVAFAAPMSPRFAAFYLPIFGNAETDGIFSPGHIADICNLLLLAFPALPLLLSIPSINRTLRKHARQHSTAGDSKDSGADDHALHDAETSFAVLLFVPWLLFLLLFKPHLSLARNWDRYMLSMLGFFPLMIVGFKTLLQYVSPAGRKPGVSDGSLDAPQKPLVQSGLASVMSPAVVITLVMSLSWMGINGTQEKSTLRFENLLAFEKASAAQGYGQLAVYHAERGSMIKAIAASEKAGSMDPSPDNLFNTSVFYLSAEDTMRAIDLLEKSIKDHPDAHTNRQALVSLLDLTARFADMTRVCKGGIQQQPNEPQYYYFLGKSYLFRGNLKEGLNALMKCKEMNPPEPVLANIDSLLSHVRKKQ